MTTTNGKNKFEHNMTKLTKYFGVSEYGHKSGLHETNEYVEIKLPTDKDLFLIVPGSCKLVKQKALMVVKPLRSESFLSFKTSDVVIVNVNMCGDCFYLVKGWGHQLETLKKCAGGDDIVEPVLLTNARVEVDKKRVFVNPGVK